MTEQRPSNQSAEQLLEAYDAAWIEDQQIGMSPSGTVTIGIITRAKERFNTARAAVLAAMRPAHEPPVAEDSCKEPDPCVAQMALDGLQAAIGRLSMAMGNPAVHWDENSSLESAVIDEATRRLSEPPAESQDAVRLRQFVESAADQCNCADVIVDLRAALAGEWLYQQLPGWDPNNPAVRPAETKEAPRASGMEEAFSNEAMCRRDERQGLPGETGDCLHNWMTSLTVPGTQVCDDCGARRAASHE